MTRDDEITWAWGERAAIMEFDGGLTRVEAERRARKIVEGRDEPEQMELLHAK